MAARPAADTPGISRWALTLAVALLLYGCGDPGESVIPVAGVTEIAGPYQAEPYRVFDQAIVDRLDEECAASFGEGPLELVLVDGRGGGHVFLVYGGPRSGECFATIDTGGEVFVKGGSIGTGEPHVPGPREVQLTSENWSPGPAPWAWVRGFAGSDISRVVIEAADGSRITASTGGGNFAAWWPGKAPPKRIHGYDASGNEVANEPYEPS